MRQRYADLLHAVQSGIAWLISSDPRTTDTGECSPKHLRVGVNSAKLEIGAVVALLIQKGVFTEDEYYVMLCKLTEKEVKSYEDLLSNKYHRTIKLG